MSATLLPYSSQDVNLPVVQQNITKSKVPSASERVFGTPELFFKIINEVVRDIRDDFDQKIIDIQWAPCSPAVAKSHPVLHQNMLKLHILRLVCRGWCHRLATKSTFNDQNELVHVSSAIQTNDLFLKQTPFAYKLCRINWVLLDVTHEYRRRRRRTKKWIPNYWALEYQAHDWVLLTIQRYITKVIETSRIIRDVRPSTVILT
jgi:hypothetical protein